MYDKYLNGETAHCPRCLSKGSSSAALEDNTPFSACVPNIYKMGVLKKKGKKEGMDKKKEAER